MSEEQGKDITHEMVHMNFIDKDKHGFYTKEEAEKMMKQEKPDEGLTDFDRQVMEEWNAQRDIPIEAHQKVDTTNTDDLSNEEMLKVLKKARIIQNKQKIIKRKIEDDFGKGSVRNQPCPNCNAKLKKCRCGFLEKNL